MSSPVIGGERESELEKKTPLIAPVVGKAVTRVHRPHNPSHLGNPALGPVIVHYMRKQY